MEKSDAKCDIRLILSQYDKRLTGDKSSYHDFNLNILLKKKNALIKDKI